MPTGVRLVVLGVRVTQAGPTGRAVASDQALALVPTYARRRSAELLQRASRVHCVLVGARRAGSCPVHDMEAALALASPQQCSRIVRARDQNLPVMVVLARSPVHVDVTQ